MSDSDHREARDDSDNMYNVTLGKSSEFETVIWRFPNTAKCPLKACRISCSSRKICLAHFNMHHSEITMICTICNELFVVENPLNILRHYQVEHPNERPPQLKTTEDTNASSKRAENTDDSDRCFARMHPNAKYDFGTVEKRRIAQTHSGAQLKVENDIENEDDDVIIMTANNITTRWRPKNLRECPIMRCRQKFKATTDFIAHFKQSHAIGSICCTLCDKPIRSLKGPHNFREHYANMHPNVTVPYGLESSRTEYKRKSIVKQEPNDHSDLIQLKYGEWRFPSETTFCPVKGCRIQFNCNSDARLHYEHQHAMNALLCPICQKPIRIDLKKNGMQMHYKQMHPDAELPYGLSKTANQSVHQMAHVEETRSDALHKNRSSTDDDDLITLTAAEGIITQWRYPVQNWKNCPAVRCNLKFKTRSDAIAHYTANHSRGAICCPICDKPINVRSGGTSDFKKHYRRMHNKVELPFDFGLSAKDSRIPRKRLHSIKMEVSDENDADEADEDTEDDETDVITLITCGITTKWKFWQFKRCPVSNCRQTFTFRSNACKHYKQVHAIGSICCPSCNHPIRSPGSLGLLKKHFKKKHPRMKVPFDVGLTGVQRKKQENQQSNKTDENDDKKILHETRKEWRTHRQMEIDSNVVCEFCKVRIQPENMKVHLKEMHGAHRIWCPLKLCNYKAKQMDEMRTHWNREHGGMAFPQFRDDSNFTYVIERSNDVDNDVGDNQKNRTIQMNLDLHGVGSSKSKVIVSSESETNEVEDSLSNQVPRSNKRRKLSDSSAWSTDIDHSGGEHSATLIVPSTKKRQRSSSSSSSASAINFDIHLKGSRKKTIVSNNGMNSKWTSKNKPITPNATTECSIVLEKVNPTNVSNFNTVNTSTATSTESIHSLRQSEYSKSTFPKRTLCEAFLNSASNRQNEVIYVIDSDE